MSEANGGREEGGWARLGARMSEARMARGGMSKIDAAAEVGLSTTTWRLLENGEYQQATDETLARLAPFLGCDPTEVLALVGRLPHARPRNSFVRHLPPGGTKVNLALAAVLEDDPKLDERGRAVLLALYEVLISTSSG